MPAKKSSKNGKLIGLLNQALAWELRAQALYAHYAAYVKGLESLTLAGHFEEEVTESTGHAQKVREVIAALGGEAVTVRAMDPIPHTEDTRVMLEHALATEQKAAAAYRKIVPLVKDNPVFYHTIYHILKDEMSAVIEMEALLGLLARPFHHPHPLQDPQPCTRDRLEAFSDGVIAIIMTIMVLELKVPHGADLERPAAAAAGVPELRPELRASSGSTGTTTTTCCRSSERVNGAILWANLHLLFWLSLIPFATAWMGENHFASVADGALRRGAAAVRRSPTSSWCGRCSRTTGATRRSRSAIGKDFKGKLSVGLYAAGDRAGVPAAAGGVRALRAGRGDVARARPAPRARVRAAGEPEDRSLAARRDGAPQPFRRVVGQSSGALGRDQRQRDRGQRERRRVDQVAVLEARHELLLPGEQALEVVEAARGAGAADRARGAPPGSIAGAAARAPSAPASAESESDSIASPRSRAASTERTTSSSIAPAMRVAARRIRSSAQPRRAGIGTQVDERLDPCGAPRSTPPPARRSASRCGSKRPMQKPFSPPARARSHSLEIARICVEQPGGSRRRRRTAFAPGTKCAHHDARAARSLRTARRTSPIAAPSSVKRSVQSTGSSPMCSARQPSAW